MSLVEEIRNAIETYLATLIPEFTKSQYVWDTTLNSDSKTKKYFSVRPSTASFVNGTCRTITVEQDFILEIGDSFRNKRDSDQDADEKIFQIYQAHETIYRALMRDNFGIARVQVVQNFSMTEPLVDNENKSVKIETTFSVKYRTE
jgi:hypothetical protein